MAERIDILTDLESDIWHEQYHVSAASGPRLEGEANWSVVKRTLRGGVSDGVDVVSVNNGALSVDVLPTRGMGLWRGEYRGMKLGWNSPVKYPVHPAYVNCVDQQGLGWLTGFNEWMCRCGLNWLGAPGLDVVDGADGSRKEQQISLHGRIANTSCHHVSVAFDDAGAGNIAIRGIMDEAWLYGPKLRLESIVRTAAGSRSLNIVDEVTNISDEPGELQLMYHTNLGQPLLKEGAQLVFAAHEIAPYDEGSGHAVDNWFLFDGPTPGYVQQCYFMEPIANELGHTTVLFQNRQKDKGISLTFNTRELPFFTLWKNLQGARDGYVIGMEPGTCFPNSKSFERAQNRVIVLPPGGSYRAQLKIEVHDSAARVAAVAEAISMQQKSAPTLHRQLHPRYSPADGLKP